MKTKHIFLFLSIIAILVQSCISPLDINAPRTRFSVEKVAPKSVSYSVTVNGVTWQCEDTKPTIADFNNFYNDTPILLDTNTFPPTVWMRMNFHFDNAKLSDTLQLNDMYVRVDSLLPDGNSIKLGNPRNPSPEIQRQSALLTTNSLTNPEIGAGNPGNCYVELHPFTDQREIRAYFTFHYQASASDTGKDIKTEVHIKY